jgi:hypothetical protein
MKLFAGNSVLNVDANPPSRYAKTRLLRRAGFMVHDSRDC